MTTAPAPAGSDTAVLAAVERRVLWLATAIVDHANRVRPNPSGLKVGGHQASSASMVTIMTALWFRHLRPQDRVSVKPHASPVLHAINYLLGELDARVPDHAARVRRAAELPEPRRRTRTRSTTPPARSASARPRRSGARWPAATSRPVRRRSAPGRQYSLVGDAELDEGAVLGGDPRPDGRRAGRGRLGRRPQPAVAGPRRARTSAPPGCRACSPRPAGRCSPSSTGGCCRSCSPGPAATRCAARIDEMSNPEYQRLLRCTRRPAAGAPARRRPGRRGIARARRRPRRRHPARRDPQPRRARPRRARRGVRARSTTPGRR